jgi:hypothetical protein
MGIDPDTFFLRALEKSDDATAKLCAAAPRQMVRLTDLQLRAAWISNRDWIGAADCSTGGGTDNGGQGAF